MILILNEKDKDKLISNGEKFICEQKLGNKTGYLFEDIKNVKLEADVEFVRTKKMVL